MYMLFWKVERDVLSMYIQLLLDVTFCFLDISETSIETCMGRYHSNKLMDRRSRKPVFEAEFIVADCCQVNIA